MPNNLNADFRERVVVFVRGREKPFLFPLLMAGGGRGTFEFSEDLGFAYVDDEHVATFPVENVLTVLKQPYLFVEGEVQ